jgi:hypothetical protein
MMRTLLLLATAATAAWMASDAQAQSQPRTERRVIVVQPQGGPADAEVYQSGDDRMVTERDYRGRWVEGDWSNDGRRFEGVYEVDQRAGPPPRGPHRTDRHGADFDGPPPGYRAVPDAGPRGRWNDEEMMRRCGRGSSGATGAALGGVAGGVIGNRLGRRGNRGVGTAIGAAAGAATGAVIERTAARSGCAEWERDYQARYSRGGYETYEGYEDGYGYGGGVQTIVIPGQPVIIEETETFYEEVAVARPRQRVRHRPARRTVHRPRPRPRCTCR